MILQSQALVDIRNTTITGSGGQGITLYDASEMTFQNNVRVEFGNTDRGRSAATWPGFGETAKMITFVRGGSRRRSALYVLTPFYVAPGVPQTCGR